MIRVRPFYRSLRSSVFPGGPTCAGYFYRDDYTEGGNNRGLDIRLFARLGCLFKLPTQISYNLVERGKKQQQSEGAVYSIIASQLHVNGDRVSCRECRLHHHSTYIISRTGSVVFRAKNNKGKGKELWRWLSVVYFAMSTPTQLRAALNVF